MCFTIIFTILSVFCAWTTGALLEDWRNIFPWRKTTPDSEFSKHIEIRLIKKDWLPEGVSFSEDERILDEYPKSVDEAYTVLRKGGLYKYNKRSLEPLDSVTELLTDQYGYNPALESIVLIHTISGDSENDFIKNIASALAMRNFIKYYNVFALEMPGLQGSMEQTVIKSALGMKANYLGFSKAVGSFFNLAIKKGLMRVDQINIITFCYSAQLAGYIARNIKENNNGLKIRTILALDPYSLGLSSVAHTLLSRKDAESVYAFHTNSFMFGSSYRVATVDVVVNNGNYQPGCLGRFNYMCSHRRSVLILWYVILYKEKFKARSCSSYFWFLIGGCKKNDILTLSYPFDMKANGKFYIKTDSHRPYGRGLSGAGSRSKVDRPKKPNN